MKKDIVIPIVKGIFVAIVKKINEAKEAEWFVVLINDNDEPIDNVMVVSRGYGEINGENRQTSQLRHSFGTVKGQSNVIIEPIDPSVFVLNNEYWVSYFIGNQMFDKRYTFVLDSIREDNLSYIPMIDLDGILHE
ncbi:MAG: hypothetical protein EAZ27_11550 [Cytophagales bacterium]|nr:MAG: hypothetical protein EAZ27_11550 [Cytophagales bacterium]